jgi:hypothetical protein
MSQPDPYAAITDQQVSTTRSVLRRNLYSGRQLNKSQPVFEGRPAKLNTAVLRAMEHTATFPGMPGRVRKEVIIRAYDRLAEVDRTLDAHRDAMLDNVDVFHAINQNKYAITAIATGDTADAVEAGARCCFSLFSVFARRRARESDREPMVRQAQQL